MLLSKYVELSARTNPTPEQYAQTTPRFEDQSELWHYVIGFSTEVAEYVQAGFKPDFGSHIIEEKGDMWWYVAGLIRWSVANNATVRIDYEFSRPVTTHDLVVVAGELLDQMKRAVFYGKLDIARITSLIQQAVDALSGMGDCEECWESNIAKLTARYPDAFSEEQALNRQVQAEREAFLKRCESEITY